MNKNWGLLGHDWAVDLLRGHLAADAGRHAYLITGPRGVGRRTLALRYAQVLNSETGVFDAESRTSQQFEQMTHPDLSVVARLEGDKNIKIGAVRDLQKSLALSPYAARFRVALLLNFEEANENAQNALLKTLEEPNRRVVLLLTAESPEALLPTISSRCEVLRLRPVGLNVVAKGLVEKWGVGEKDAEMLAHISGGRPGYAVYLYENPEELSKRGEWLDACRDLLGEGKVARFGYAAKIAKEKEDFRRVMQVWLSYWRDILMQAAEADTPVMNMDRREEISEISGRLGVDAAREMVRSLEKTIGLLGTNTNVRLAAEVLMIDMPNI